MYKFYVLFRFDVPSHMKKTDSGRIFFMFFVIPGIGIFGALLVKLQRIVSLILDKWEELFITGANKKFPRLRAGVLYWFSVSIAMLGIFWLVPAAVTFALSDFNFFESVYFSLGIGFNIP